MLKKQYTLGGLEKHLPPLNSGAGIAQTQPSDGQPFLLLQLWRAAGHGCWARSCWDSPAHICGSGRAHRAWAHSCLRQRWGLRTPTAGPLCAAAPAHAALTSPATLVGASCK